jgi:hypothetical protein
MPRTAVPHRPPQPASTQRTSARSAPTRPASRRRRAGGAAAAVAVSAAAALSVVGLVLLLVMLGGRPTPAEAVVGGVALRVQEAGWLQMDHADGGGGSGFQMPAAMMPGAPEAGHERLRVQVTLANRGDGPWRVRGGTFRLEDAAGASWPLQGQSIGVDQLPPGLAVSGSLQFDVPTERARAGAGGGFRLVWERDGKVAELAVPIGAAPDHDGGH